MEWIPDWLLQIIIASVGATISGVILLITHHSKVKQELEIHRKKEVFERKQRMYRNLVDQFLAFLDLKHNPTHDRGNWRIGNYLYTELVLIGGKSVIQAFNNHLKSKLKGTDNDIEHTNKIKDVLIAIRKDLYDEELDYDEINFIQPTQETHTALSIIEENYPAFESYNLTTLQEISDMDIEKIHSETKIPIEKLSFLKNTALQERKIQDEFEIYLDKIVLNNDQKEKSL